MNKIYKILVLFILGFSFVLNAEETDQPPIQEGEHHPHGKFRDGYRHFCEHHHDNHNPDQGLSVGIKWLMPVGNLYDRWNSGLGLDIGVDFLSVRKVMLGITFEFIDLDPNTQNYTSSSDWDTNMYHVGIQPKYYFFDHRLFFSPTIGWFGIRRNIPNYGTLSTTLQSELKNENNVGLSAELGIPIWDFLVFGAGYMYVFDEGQALTINFALDF